MATAKRYGAEKPKRIRKRKARTEVSSSSESSSSSSESESESEGTSGSETPEPTTKKVKESGKVNKKVKRVEKAAVVKEQFQKTVTPTPTPQTTDTAASKAALVAAEAAEAASAATLAAEDSFTTFYLRQTTLEFSEDLDKIRSAGDFNDKSLGLLIVALKQGTLCFGSEERVGVGRGFLVPPAAETC